MPLVGRLCRKIHVDSKSSVLTLEIAAMFTPSTNLDRDLMTKGNRTYARRHFAWIFDFEPNVSNPSTRSMLPPNQVDARGHDIDCLLLCNTHEFPWLL